MSTLHNSLARLIGWARTHALLLVAAGAALALIVTIFITTFRIYDERQARLTAVEELTRRTAANAAANRQRALEQCEATNGTNGTVRFILGAGLRLRSPDNPISPELRQAYIEAYRQLPLTDCATGEKTYYDPPFPP
jgi:hypothetical protein